jgi:competence protein ComFC
LRELILLFKAGRTEAAGVLGFLAKSALAGGGFEKEVDFVVPVPLHWTRNVQRGYNQSQILARRLAGDVNTELVRIRRTKPQAAMASAHQRLKNVEGAFAVRSGHRFAGRNICLVDDIKTTGATLNECAKILKQAGAAKVFAVVLAVADQRAD